MKNRTVEDAKLFPIRQFIAEILPPETDAVNASLCLLEQVSCAYSGIDINDYWIIIGNADSVYYPCEVVERVKALISESGISHPLVLSALARVEKQSTEVKKQGSVYTDFRLAQYLASQAIGQADYGSIIDPACGTGVLLAACAVSFKDRGGDSADFVANKLYGVDCDAMAIRGTLLSLASMIKTGAALRRLKQHFACLDSLTYGLSLPSVFGLDSFDCVIGNPPWERVRPSRIEYAHEQGNQIKYGEKINQLPLQYFDVREKFKQRSKTLAETYEIKGNVDLYHAFLRLSDIICSDRGSIHILLPAGFIRSKGLAGTRENMAKSFSSIEVSVFMNHAKFFYIDSRFKFLLVRFIGKHKPAEQISGVRLKYCSANSASVVQDSSLILKTQYFCDASHELGVPEVKDENESNLLEKIWQHSKRMSVHPLFAGRNPVRELDMTLDRSLFVAAASTSSFPLIEGRMVSQFRYCAKSYLSGEGRSAQWRVSPWGSNTVEPQYWINPSQLPLEKRKRASRYRIGFCDIAGQTNERAMQAALIPKDCICGNKVPTIDFANQDVSLLWLGIANSFVFDWIVRRYITNTVNFFILVNLPFPDCDLSDSSVVKIIDAVKTINNLEESKLLWSDAEFWNYAMHRAKIDWLVMQLYRLAGDDIDLISQDFPLVDRINRCVSDVESPTFDLLRFEAGLGDRYLERAKRAFEDGARPYCMNEYLRVMLKKKR